MAVKKMKLVGLAVLLILLAFYLIGTVDDSRLSNDGEHIGLWQLCTVAGCAGMGKSPAYLTPFLHWFSAVRSFLIMSCIFIAIAFTLLVCNICDEEHFKVKPVRVCTIFCVLFLINAIAFFAVERYRIYGNDWKFGWTFYIVCVSFVLTLIGIFLLYRINVDDGKTFSPASSYQSQQNAFEANKNNDPKRQFLTNFDYSPNHASSTNQIQYFAPSINQNDEKQLLTNEKPINGARDSSDNDAKRKEEDIVKEKDDYTNEESEESVYSSEEEDDTVGFV